MIENNNIKLSIIIPVYKVEQYLSECIDSVLNQHLTNIEIILVDDGSPDNCPKICDEYASKNKIIKVIHKENGGLSSARNSGIKEASGEYLMFIDSDDYLNPDADVKELFKYMNGVDVIQYNFAFYFDDTKKIVYLKEPQIDNDRTFYEQILKKIENDDLSVQAWSKVVRKDLIFNNNLFFEEGILSEDIDWSLKVYLYAKSLFTCNNVVYMYRQNRNGSITNKASKKRVDSLYFVVRKWIEYKYNSAVVKDCYLSYIAYQYTILLTLIDRKNTTKELRKEIYSLKEILNNDKHWKVKLSNKVLKLFGVKLGRHILKVYLSLKNKGLIKL
ncbi:MAG: glycosyltransferase [Clostridia bacterium]|nr:glycosyltransferase [Clostridia bacterium]